MSGMFNLNNQKIVDRVESICNFNIGGSISTILLVTLSIQSSSCELLACILDRALEFSSNDKVKSPNIFGS